MPKTVLHIDDDPSILRLVSIVLRKRGFDPVSVEKPEEALSSLVKTSARVVLLDMNMERIDGLSLLRAIKAQDAGIQTIVLSGSVSMITVKQTMECGAEEFLFKPITDLQVLLSSVERAFAKIERWQSAMQECSKRKPIPSSSEFVLEPQPVFD